MWKQNIAGFIKGFLRSLPIAGIGIAVLAIPLGLLGQLAFALPILVVPIFAALSFIVLPLVVAATFRSVRGRGRWQFAGAITVYVALAVAVAWVIAPDRIDFDPSSEWSDDGIETVAFWDGESDDSTAPLALAAFLVERFVFLEKGSTLADPKIKQAFARKSGSDCDLHDPSVEFGMMQYFGHFGVCIVPETTGIDLKDAILIKRGRRGERLAAVAYQLIDGKPPVEVARWKRAKNFFPGFFPPRSYLNEVEFVFDVAGPTASKKFAASAFTLEEWVDAAYKWVGKTRLELACYSQCEERERWKQRQPLLADYRAQAGKLQISSAEI